MPGPAHPVNVKCISQKALDKKAKAKKNETIRGCYVPSENTIYIAAGLDPFVFAHTMWHEIKHMFDDQTCHMSEEDKCDAYATMRIAWEPNFNFLSMLKEVEK